MTPLKRILFIVCILVTLFNVAFAQPGPVDVNEKEKEAAEAAKLFCDEEQPLWKRLQVADKLNWLTPTKHRPQIASIGERAMDEQENTQVRSLALAFWYNGDPARAIEGIIKILDDPENGNYSIRYVGCTLLHVTAGVTPRPAYRDRLHGVLKSVMTNRDESVAIRKAVVEFLARRPTDMAAIRYCATALETHQEVPTEDCPMDAQTSIAILIPLGEQFRSLVRLGLKSRFYGVRIMAIDALSLDAESRPEIRSIFQDTNEDDRVRATAARALVGTEDFLDLVVPVIEKEGSSDFTAECIYFLAQHIRPADWRSRPANRARLPKLKELCDKWMQDFEGDAQEQAARASGYISEWINKDD